jgi:DHA1 family multidrug resistance protein-like MFS transporter
MFAEDWKRNLYVMFVVELIVIMGFSFVIPFLPLYIQETGNLNTDEAAFWSGIAGSAAGIAMFLSSPIWGILADRWGRKPMVLRAMFGGGIVIAAMGLVHNIYGIIALRFLQGLLSGTVAAASALVAANTPRDKMAFAMGLLMMAVYGGTSIGPLIGGILADKAGFAATFYITGVTLFVGGIIVIIFVKEEFVPPTKGESTSIASMLNLARSREMLPILGVTLILNAGPAILSPILPLYIRELNPLISAETAAGTAFFLMGLVATASSYVAGRLGQRIDLKKILIFSCLGSGVLYLLPMLATNATQFLIFIATMGLLRGGMISSSSTLVGLVAPLNQQGIAYGINQSASSLGGAIGPLIGGVLAPLLGLKSIFAVTAGIFVITGLLVSKLISGLDLSKTRTV